MENLIQPTTKFYGREDGMYSVWDHPNYFSEPHTPLKDYRPLHTMTQVLSNYYEWPMDLRELYLTVLTVVSQSICVTEDQLRRYMLLKTSRAQTGKALNYLRKYGYIQRYTSSIYNPTKDDFDGENNDCYEKIDISAPLNIGIAGYLLLTYIDPHTPIIRPETWMQHTRHAMIQRYVTMNELHCTFMEAGIKRKWGWFPRYRIQDGKRYRKPFAVMEIGEKTELDDTRMWLIFERAQVSQDFIGYLKTRLNEYEYLITTYGTLPIAVKDAPAEPEQAVVISCGSVKVAEAIQQALGLQRYSYHIWLLVDELFDTDEDVSAVSKAFMSPVLDRGGESYSLQRLHVQF